MSDADGNARLRPGRILSLLPNEERERLAAHSQHVELTPREVLYGPGEPTHRLDMTQEFLATRLGVRRAGAGGGVV